jgi:hypothetical protein
MRAADDFTAIHARLEELRHEQERPAGGDKEERLGTAARNAEGWKTKVAVQHRPGLE